MRILVIGYPWEGLFQRSQQLASCLARSHRVVYWQSTHFWARLLADSLRRRTTWRGFIQHQPAPNLTVVSVPLALPYRIRNAIPAVHRQLHWLQARAAAEVIPLAPYDAAILATYDSSDAGLWERIPARVRVYDCYDDVTHFFPAGSKAAGEATSTENRILKHADLVLASAPRLLERLAQIHDRVLLVPNGVDADLFRSTAHPVPAELAGITEPILGFVGAIEPWIDLELIARVADLLPEYRLVLVGPVGRDVSPLRRRRNILLVGRKAYPELPALLQRFDVCMIPFVESELTRSVDPVKFYEYCAAGKPVVSTPLPTMVARRDVAYLAATAEDFSAQVRRAKTEDSARLRECRVALARANSWQARAETITCGIRESIRGQDAALSGS